MKKILFLALFVPLGAMSQTGWNYLPNAPVAVGRIEDVSFINDSTGWAANSDGFIYKTADGGNSWITQLQQTGYIRSVEFFNDSLGFAGTLQDSVYKTTDGGDTWTIINPTFPQPVPGICGIGHFGNIIIMVGRWNQPGYILRSADYGVTWTYSNLSPLAGALVDCWFKDQDTVFVSGQGTTATGKHGVILRSTDGGLTWQPVGSTPAANTYCWKLQFPSVSTGYSSQEEMTGSSSDIMKTMDGGSTWVSMNVTNQNIDMEGIGFANDTLGWVGGGSPGLYETIDGGNSWTFYNFGQNFNRFTFLNPDLGYAGGQSVYKFSGITTGINPLPGNTEKLIHQFDLFPNPSSDILKITLFINKNTNVIFEIYDNNGNLISELVNDKLNKNIYYYEYDLSNKQEGNYYIVMRTNEHFLTKKFTLIK